MFRFGADDILRVINEKVNLSSLNERRYDLARLRLTFLGNVQLSPAQQKYLLLPSNLSTH